MCKPLDWQNKSGWPPTSILHLLKYKTRQSGGYFSSVNHIWRSWKQVNCFCCIANSWNHFRYLRRKSLMSRNKMLYCIHNDQSVQFSHSVVSDSLRPHELQHAKPPCPSTTPGVHSNSCPSSRWCHPAISSFVVPFSSCPKSLPSSGSFPMSQLFAWGSQSIGVSALASVRPKNTQDWSPSEWTGWH